MSMWFITGAGRGLGAEIARVAIAAGDTVAAAVRDPQTLPDDLVSSPRVAAIQLDVTDSPSIPRAVAEAETALGPIDVLVNNAGRGLLGALEEITDAEARALFDLNVFGLINMTRAVLPGMRERRSGALVHIGSRSGFEGEPGVSMYAASKFAVAGISEALAVELAPFGIRSMVVEPGVFRTDFLDATSVQLPAGRVADYDGTAAHLTLDWAADANHTQAGDPVKGAALIHRVVSSDTLPSHLLLGADAIDRRAAVTERIDREMQPWITASRGTAHR